ncbi:MAG: hypothetical protein DRR08_32890 [Candidatus Parabeggiatoa sp. nov. 2]|nr:MAG: hypothetical protein DRR08_32890 [Gammaproteobacteria bacterium]
MLKYTQRGHNLHFCPAREKREIKREYQRDFSPDILPKKVEVVPACSIIIPDKLSQNVISGFAVNL